ncbi:MAG: gluconate 2-dehydrogenase subunit 3 family protein [Flavobacteriales bacterium]|nr:MAG: gluconate 2-dehydrogenase subunit 3 family protein [Flavobacteriales bacterium]
MDRRRVLKKIGYGSAAMIVSPQIINMLHSCKSNVNKHLPIFFANNQFQFVSKIMDLVIPKTDIPGAIELKLPEFLDKYIVVVMNQNDKETILRRTNNFIKLILNETKKNGSMEINSNDLNTQLKKYLLASDKQIESWEEAPRSQELEVYNYLIQIRSLTLNAFRLNEYIGEKVLAYDPIPGERKVCLDLKKTTGGKRWSL